MAQLNLSHTLTAGTPENINDVQDNFQDIVDHVNNALVGDDNLTSPNNSVWRPVFQVSASRFDAGMNAANSPYMLAPSLAGQSASAGTQAFYVPLFHVVAADVAVSGKTTQVRVTADIATNSTAPGVTFTVGLYRVTASAGGASALSFTLGTVAATATFTTPAATSISRTEGTAVTLPTAGTYLLAVVLGGTIAASSLVSMSAAVEMRHN